MSNQTIAHPVTQIIAGTNITITSTGGLPGTGQVTINSTGGGGGITSINAQIGAAQTFSTTSLGTDFTITSGAPPNNHQWNLPDAGPLARGVVTTLAQTFAGIKTFSADIHAGAQIVGTAATFNIVTDSVDGTDNRIVNIASGSVASNTRGGYITLNGNEAAGLGSVVITGGDTTGNIVLFATSATGEVQFSTVSIDRWRITAAGDIHPFADNVYDIGTPLLYVKAAYIRTVFSDNLAMGFPFAEIRVDTVDGADTGLLTISASDNAGTNRAGYIQLYGNESAGLGSVQIYAGDAGGSISLTASAPAGEVQFATVSVDRWRVTAAGHFIPFLDNVYDIGSPTFRVRNIYGNVISGTFVLPNDTFLSGRNFANTLDVGLIKIDTADNTVINADTGNAITFYPSATLRLTLNSSGNLIASPATTYLTPFLIATDSVDGADNKVITITGGGQVAGGASTTRGAFLVLAGNEETTIPGWAQLTCGDVAGGQILLQSGGAQPIIFSIAGTERYRFSGTTGHFFSTAGYFIGIGTTPTVPLDIAAVNATANIRVTDSTNGARIQLVTLAVVGDIYNQGGTDGIVFGTTTADNTSFKTNAIIRWHIDSAGHFVPLLDNTYDIGAPTFRVANIYAANFFGSLVLPNNVSLFSRNFANTGNIALIVGTTNDDTLINSTTVKDILFAPAGLVTWRMLGSSGDLVPNVSASYRIGANNNTVAEIFWGATGVSKVGQLIAGAVGPAAGSFTNVPFEILANNTLTWQFDTNGDLSNNVTNGRNVVFNRDLSGVADGTDAAVAAAGTTQGTATVLTKVYSVVTTATVAVATGVLLPSGATYIGQEFIVLNRTAAVTISVYPGAGEQIEALGANTPTTVLAGANVRLKKATATQWYIV